MNYQEAGQKLRERRISLNREPEQVTSDLKISQEKLEAIETGDAGYFGDLLFYNLFYSTYARYLGLESEDDQQIIVPEKSYPVEKSKEKVKINIIYIVVTIVIIMFISVFILWKELYKPKQINGNQPPQTEVPIDNKPIENPPIPPLVKEVVVKLLVIKDKCWLQVNIDGNDTPVFRRTLFVGDEIEFKGEKEVRLWIGNAGAIKIIVNGIEQPAIGKDGEVIRDLVFYPPD